MSKTKKNRNKRKKEKEIVLESENEVKNETIETQNEEIVPNELYDETVEKNHTKYSEQLEKFKKSFSKAKEFWCKKIFPVLKKNFGLILSVFVILFTLINVITHIIGGNVTKDYSDYSKYQITYSQIMKKGNNGYYVYFYSESCSHCKNLKKDIFQYLDSDKNNSTNGVRLYLLCVDEYLNELSSDTDNIIGVTDVSNLKISGTPTMIYVSTNSSTNTKVISNSWSSESKIKTQLSNS